jgi:transposase
MQITLDLPDAVVSLLGDAPERTIYKLIKAHLSPPADAAPRGRPITNAERDAAIADKAVAGVTHAAIANEYGLSNIRVSQIVAQGKAAALERNPQKAESKKRRILSPEDITTIMRMRADGAMQSEIMDVFSLTLNEVQDVLWSAPNTITNTPAPKHKPTTTITTTKPTTPDFDFDISDWRGQP